MVVLPALYLEVRLLSGALHTAVSSEAWAKLCEWAILAGKGQLLLSGSIVLPSLKAAVYKHMRVGWICLAIVYVLNLSK